jgi:hypothetical protein
MGVNFGTADSFESSRVMRTGAYAMDGRLIQPVYEAIEAP